MGARCSLFGQGFVPRERNPEIMNLSPYIEVTGTSGYVPLWREEERPLFWKIMKSFLRRGGKRLTPQYANRCFQRR